MLLGASAVIALMRTGGDDAGLAIVPAMDGDAGALPDAGVRTIGGDQEPGRDRAPIRKRDQNVRARIGLAGHALRHQLDTIKLGALDQRGKQWLVLHHMSKWSARLDLPVEADDHRAHRVPHPPPATPPPATRPPPTPPPP